MKNVRPAIALACICVGMLTAQSYVLKSVVVDAGGHNRVQSGAYAAGLSFGQQTASSVLTGNQYNVVLGFWHGPYAPVGVREEAQRLLNCRLDFGLQQCCPNPFGRRTRISYSLPQESDVALRIYNSAGRVVTTLSNGRQRPGRYEVSWDVSGVPTARLPCGTYFCRLEAGEFTATRKMVKTE